MQTPVSNRDHIRGDEYAPVTLLQYGDYECPVSRKVYRVIQALYQNAEGKIGYAYRHFPLTKVHPHAMQAAISAEAAGEQDKFWEMHDMLFQNQKHLEDEDLMQYAETLQLDPDKFAEDLKDDKLAKKVRKNQYSGLKNGIESTSNLFINGIWYGGEMNVEKISQAVEMQTGAEVENPTSDHPGQAKTRAIKDKPPANQETKKRTISEICEDCLDVNSVVLESVLGLAIDIAREGREGRKIGTIFTVGDAGAVMRNSRALVMDPLLGHLDEDKHIDNPNMRETIKELAQLDGGFVVTGDGVVLSAARYFDASSQGVELPLGLGSRHMAGASISLHTSAVAVVVSESSMVRLFHGGEVQAEIVPELWMLRRFGLTPADEDTATSDEVTVIE